MQKNETLAELIKLLFDADPNCRFNAVRLLGQMGPAAHPAVDVLINLLDDDDLDVCMESAITLGAIGVCAEPSIAALVQILLNPGKKSDRLANHAACIFEGLLPPMGNSGFDIAQGLAKMLSSTNEKIRYAGALGMSRLSNSLHLVPSMLRSSVFPSIIDGLDEKSSYVRYWCSETIRNLSIEAILYFNDVLRMIVTEDENIFDNILEFVTDCVKERPALMSRVYELGLSQEKLSHFNEIYSGDRPNTAPEAPLNP